MCSFLLAALLASPSLARADDAPSDAWVARLTTSSGTVEVRSSGSEAFESAEPVRDLHEGDTLRTGKQSYAEIALDGDGVMELQPGTTLAIANLRRKTSIWKLSVGALVSKLRKLVEGEKLQVKTPTAVAAVRGTEFAVTAKAGVSRVGVFDEGLVAVTDARGGHEVDLEPNQETSAAKNAAPAAPGALQELAVYRSRMKLVRKRLDDIRAAWRQRNNLQRQELHDKLNRLRRDKQGQ
jgi:hypothetical protein